MLEIRESFVNADTNTMFGESDWYEPWTQHRGQLFRALQSEYGRCISKIYTDTATQTLCNRGWVFQGRDKMGDSDETYMREVWVHVREVSP